MRRTDLVTEKSFNPFSFIFETKKYPHARTLRTTFRKKVEDAYYVFAGTKKTAGILDYFGLMLPYLLTKGFESINMAADPFLKLFLAIPYAVVQSFRMVFSALLTLVSLPVIGAVSLVADYQASQLREDAQNTPCEYARGFSDSIPEESRDEIYAAFDQYMLQKHPDLNYSSKITNGQAVEYFDNFLAENKKYKDLLPKDYDHTQQNSAVPIEERKKPSDHLPQMQYPNNHTEPSTIGRYATTEKMLDRMETTIVQKGDESILKVKKHAVGRMASYPVRFPDHLEIGSSQAQNCQAFFKLNVGGAVTMIERQGLEETFQLNAKN